MRRILDRLNRATSAYQRKMLRLQGQSAAIALRQASSLNHISEAGFSVFSQWDEDGILEWLLQALPPVPNTFVEFGVETYEEANTRFLLEHRNWRGLVIDGDPRFEARLRAQEIYWKHSVVAVSAFVNRDNIGKIIAANGFRGRIGVLSIDIDGNDYWVWEAIDCAMPDIVICEYNAVFGDLHPVSIPYDEAFVRWKGHPSGLYWGASIKALEHLAARKGYRLPGSNRNGNNAFFVRDELFDGVAARIADRTARPSLFRESRDGQGKLTFATGAARSALVADMPVVLVDTGRRARLGDLGELCSARWQALLGSCGESAARAPESFGVRAEPT